MEEKTKYSKKAQITLMIICALSYTIAYLGRYSYSANINLVISEYNITKAEAGLVTSFFFFSYGIGQLINGILCKYYNKRLIIVISLIISSIINFILFFNIPFKIYKYIWMINGFAQSFLWPSLILTLSENLDKEYLKPSILMMSATVPVGTFIIYLISSLFVSFNNYKITFIFSTILLIIASIMWFILYPKSIRKEKLNFEVKEQKNDSSKTYSLVFKSVLLILFSLSIFAILDNLIKDGIQTWMPTILKESYGMSDSISISLSLVLPLFSILGATLVMIMHKKIKDYVILSMIMFILTSALILLSTLLFDLPYYFLIIIVFVIIEILVHAINNIITSMAPLLLRRKMNSGFMAGILNGMCYVGSVISSYGLGALYDKTGSWKSVFTILFYISLVATIVGIIYIIINEAFKNIEKKQQNHPQE